MKNIKLTITVDGTKYEDVTFIEILTADDYISIIGYLMTEAVHYETFTKSEADIKAKLRKAVLRAYMIIRGAVEIGTMASDIGDKKMKGTQRIKDATSIIYVLHNSNMDLMRRTILTSEGPFIDDISKQWDDDEVDVVTTADINRSLNNRLNQFVSDELDLISVDEGIDKVLGNVVDTDEFYLN